jgi:ADP-heptose:LPS heptosyltransferase
MKNEAIISTDFRLNETAALLEKMKLFISVDTGPLHIAHALNVPVVNIIGPTTLDEQAPRDERSEIVHKDIYCAPCFFNMSTINYCKEGHHRCIKEIMVDDVFGAVVKLIKRTYV